MSRLALAIVVATVLGACSGSSAPAPRIAAGADTGIHKIKHIVIMWQREA